MGALPVNYLCLVRYIQSGKEKQTFSHFSTKQVKGKGALTWYRKLIWESVYASNLIILCSLIVWGMAFIFMVHESFYANPLLIYDVMNDITIIP